ncbi:hypothetical protein L484_008897 [Morus notabilis]|uniref:Uncharacterized protein n=1 Tax=Morus notabilis TaxID=981085 RepID=W9REX3_9ROSA|nr:hypothetical protein L484_008897 [Morus notabilis]
MVVAFQKMLLCFAFVLIALFCSSSNVTEAREIAGHSKRLSFGVLPKGTPAPPSGPSGKLTPPSPSYPAIQHLTEAREIAGHSKRLNFGMLPKRAHPYPPSGPSRKQPPPSPDR